MRLEFAQIATQRADAHDSQMNFLLADEAIRLNAEPHRWPEPAPRPDIAPSYQVYISLSNTRGTDSSEGPDHLVYRGFDLRGLLSKVCRKNPSRILLPPSLDDGRRYDAVLVLPREMEQPGIYRLVRQAIEDHFSTSLRAEIMAMDVYVMTAVPGERLVCRTGADAFGGGFTSWSEWVAVSHDAPPPTGISDFAAVGLTMDGIRLALEQVLKRPILDETGLQGVYDVRVHGEPSKHGAFLQMLREQSGITLTPLQRNIEMLVVAPTNPEPADSQ